MKAVVASLVRTGLESGVDPTNTVREYLQARILGAMQRTEAMLSVAFRGGTALRFLYALPRFSEGLDFALERPDRCFELERCLRRARRELDAEGYEVELKAKLAGPVQSGTVKIVGLLHELGIVARPEQGLRIKVEVDTNPPAGASLDTSIVRRHVTLRLQHHDRSSLLAGKLHAILQRPWTKGRDLFDLLWYLSDRSWPEPNLTLLNNALQQTGWAGAVLTPRTWRVAVRRTLDQVDWKRAQHDVRPFLEPGAGIELINRDDVLRLLEG